MTSAPPPATGIQPTGNSARASIALSASVRARDRKNEFIRAGDNSCEPFSIVPEAGTKLKSRPNLMVPTRGSEPVGKPKKRREWDCHSRLQRNNRREKDRLSVHYWPGQTWLISFWNAYQLLADQVFGAPKYPMKTSDCRL